MFKLFITFVFLIIFVNAIHLSESKHTSKNDKCTTCHFIVDATTAYVEKYNATIFDVTNLVKDLCKDIGTHVISAECDFFIDNIQKLVLLIEAGISSDNICKIFGFC
jgi:hypothetical protein